MHHYTTWPSAAAISPVLEILQLHHNHGVAWTQRHVRVRAGSLRPLHAPSSYVRRTHTQAATNAPASTSAATADADTGTARIMRAGRRWPAARDRAPQICILGGGFGGLCTAVSLDSRDWPAGRKPEITLVDQHERFVFKPLMYELLSHRATDQEVRGYENLRIDL